MWLLARRAVEADVVDAKPAVMHRAAVGDLEAHGGCTTTLGVGHLRALRVAGRGVLAGRAIRHAIDEVDIRLLLRVHMERLDGESVLVGTAADLGT